MSNIFRPVYRELSPREKDMVEMIKAYAADLNEVYERGPANRELALARTKLEESVMWAVKGITG